MNKPIYVVQTQVISLGGKPFLLENEVKSPYQALFTSNTCFTDLRQSILDSSRYIQFEDSYEDGHWHIHKPQLIPLPGKPFIPGWSQVCFNTRSLLFSDTEERTELAQKLAQREMFWDRKAKKAKVSVDPDVFGFDPLLGDQRMNMLFFEIYNPLYLTAFYKNRKMASGRVFLHIYPGGYLVLHLAVRFNENIIDNKENLIKAVHETQPWRKNINWEWDSRIAHGSLDKIISHLQKITISSIMQQGNQKRIVKRNWFTSIKIFEDWDMQDLAKSLFDRNIKAVELKRFENELNYYDESYEQDDYQNANEGTHVERGLVVSREGVILCLPGYFRRKKALGQFWKVLEMAEFTLVKDQFYEDLANYLGPETEKLLDYRLDKKRKLSKESLLKFTIYNPEIPQMMSALEKHLHSATSFYRFIHSCIADGIEHYEKKVKVKNLVERWITEVEKWESNFKIIWSSIMGPLKEILGLIK